MPISLQQIATNTATLTITWGDDIINLVYYPGKFTEKVVADVQAISELNENTLVAGLATFNETLANLIQDWDVYEDTAMTTKFPIDPKRFPELPLSFRMQIFSSISNDLRPNTVAPQIQN